MDPVAIAHLILSRYHSQRWRQNLKTQDSGKGLWESWVGNSRIPYGTGSVSDLG